MMEDLMSQMECGDSIVMRILRSAMDKAHEKLQFKDGTPTFYELAAILVEGCLDHIVQEESEMVESKSCNKILSDLMQIKEWLVAEKDREFRERLENDERESVEVWRRSIERDVESVVVQTRFDMELKKRVDEMRNLLKDFFSTNDDDLQSPSSDQPNLDIVDDLLENGRPRVGTIIRIHESIIRRQREQTALHALQREREGRIRDAINNLALKGVGGRIHDDRSSCFEEEINKLQEERDGLCFQISVTQDIYQLLFRGVLQDSSTAELCCGEKEGADESQGLDISCLHYMESSIREDIYAVVFQETLKQWELATQSDCSKTPSEDFRCSPTESLLREDIYLIVFQGTIKQWKTTQFDPTPESLLREEIYKIYLREMTEAWRSEELKHSENMLETIKRFRFLVDTVLHENLESKCLRVEALKRQVDELKQPVAWIQSRKLLYEKAFISRCRNLKLAETEVDLLGDEVQTLVNLLERIYLVLNQNATVLSPYFEVYDILKLIKIELNGSKPKIYIQNK